MIDYTFNGSDSLGSFSGSVQQARTDVLNLQSSINELRAVVDNCYSLINNISLSLDQFRFTEFSSARSDILNGITALMNGTESAVETNYQNLQDVRSSINQNILGLNLTLHNDLVAVETKLSTIENYTGLSSAKINNIDSVLEEYVNTKSVSNRNIILMAVSNSQRKLMQGLSTVPFHSSTEIAGGQSYELYIADNDDPDGAVSGDHTLLQLIEGSIAGTAAGIVSIRSNVLECKDLVSAGFDNVLTVFCFTSENFSRLVLGDSIDIFEGSIRLSKEDTGWSTVVGDDALPIVSKSYVCIPQKLRKYGPFKGVFPNQEATYYYSQELAKILAMPWRTSQGYGGTL